MMKVLFALLAVVALAHAANVGVAHLRGTATYGLGIDGLAYFVQVDATTHWVWINITGITNGTDTQHGIHVHQFGDLADTTGLRAGGHYAGAGSTTHGCEDTTTRHEGDMGNWQATAGVIYGEKTLDLLASNGTYSIIGKAIVLHQKHDNCSVQPTGDSGNRLATGVIAIANPAYFPQAVIDKINLVTVGNVSINGAISADPTVLKAVAILTPTVADATAFPSVGGIVTFEQDGTGVITISGWFNNLPLGRYGFHIHTFGDYFTNSTVNGLSAGPHFELLGNPHGAPGNSTRHAGDLGNICTFDVTITGRAYYYAVMNDTRFSLNGDNNILGRNVLVHAVYDTMLPSFSSFGARISQGVIGVMNNTGLSPFPSAFPAASTISSPLCPTIVAPTAAPGTTGPAASTTTTGSPVVSTTTTTSSASLITLCYATILVVFAVIMF